MTFDEAFDEVMKAAEQPRIVPEGTRTLTEPDLDDRQYRSGDMKHEELTEAQTIVAKWIWTHCGHYLGPYERWEAGFCQDLNVNHEIALWVKLMVIFHMFHKRHPSESPDNIINTLCSISAGFNRSVLSEKRTAELKRMIKKMPSAEYEAVMKEIWPTDD